MRRPLRPFSTSLAPALACLTAALGLGALAAAVDDREIPPPLAPLEFLVGSWKGQGVSLEDPSQRVRGWTETHAWAWSFAAGKPTGMTFKLDGSKVLKAGTLVYDEAKKKYVLKGETPTADKNPETLVFEGTYDASRKLLTLDRTDAPAGGRAPDRLTLRPNANFIRYTLSFERKSGRSGAATRMMEVGLTKEGETFAAGSSAVERPKCIVTGGSATQTLSYQGRDFPICCSGCRDEFLESPEKYLKKLAATPAADSKKKAEPPARRPSGNDDF